MPERQIAELASEVAREINSKLSGLGIQSIEQEVNTLKVTLFWVKPFHLEITLVLRDQDTEETIKEEIKRQILAAGPQFF